MKNLLIYISPEKGFDKEHEELTKIQIDNSLELGWKKEDIMLVTNFAWNYNGIKAHVIRGKLNAIDGNRSSKILAINRLFDQGKIRDGDVVWFHDHDAFQLLPFEEPKLGENVMAITSEGYRGRWNAGSFFFNRGAADLFMKVYDSMIENNTNEQDALTSLIGSGLTGCVRLNNRYNLGIYKIDFVLRKIEQPLLVAHFHPHKRKHRRIFNERNLLPERLLKIFAKYGLK